MDRRVRRVVVAQVVPDQPSARHEHAGRSRRPLRASIDGDGIELSRVIAATTSNDASSNGSASAEPTLNVAWGSATWAAATCSGSRSTPVGDDVGPPARHAPDERAITTPDVEEPCWPAGQAARQELESVPHPGHRSGERSRGWRGPTDARGRQPHRCDRSRRSAPRRSPAPPPAQDRLPRSDPIAPVHRRERRGHGDPRGKGESTGGKADEPERSGVCQSEERQRRSPGDQ